MVEPTFEPSTTRDLGCVEVFDELMRLPVAIGRLTLSSPTEGAMDFAACSTAPPAPGWYTLSIEERTVGALIRAPSAREPSHIVVTLEEPIA